MKTNATSQTVTDESATTANGGYKCGCIADASKVSWQAALDCPPGTAPLGADMNVCRVGHEWSGDPIDYSAGWIKSGERAGLQLSVAILL